MIRSSLLRLFCTIVSALLVGCYNQSRHSMGSVYDRSPAQYRIGGEKQPVRIVVSAAFTSEAGTSVYKKLAEYLEMKTGYPCELISGFSYKTLNAMLEAGVVDIGFICGYPYVLMHDRPHPPVRLMAAPVPAAPRYRGQPIYFSDIIVRADSSYRCINQLKGCTWAYSEELSNSGYNLPRAFLIRKGLHRGFLARVVRTGSHEESIRAVATGEADAAAVDSLVLDYERARGSPYAQRVRILYSLGPSGIVPVVASARMPEHRFKAIQAVLLHMASDAEGAAILREAGLKTFVYVKDSHYNDIRAAHRLAMQKGYQYLQNP